MDGTRTQPLWSIDPNQNNLSTNLGSLQESLLVLERTVLSGDRQDGFAKNSQDLTYRSLRESNLSGGSVLGWPCL